MEQTGITLKIVPQVCRRINDASQIIYATPIFTAAETKHGEFIIEDQPTMRVNKQLHRIQFGFDLGNQFHSLLEAAIHEMPVDPCRAQINKTLNPEVVILQDARRL